MVKKLFLIIIFLITVSITKIYGEKKEELRNNEQVIKELMQEFINTENSEKQDEIKKRIIRIESNPDKLKELLINSAKYRETPFAIHEKFI